MIGDGVISSRTARSEVLQQVLLIMVHMAAANKKCIKTFLVEMAGSPSNSTALDNMQGSMLTGSSSLHDDAGITGDMQLIASVSMWH